MFYDMDMTTKKSYTIQLLRGIAIIAVVFIHNTPEGLYQVFCRPFFNFSVGLFLFLSGILSNVNKWKPWKRISKVVIPYITWTLIYVIIYNYKEPTHIPVEFVMKLITGKAAAVMYYIFVYCELTLLIPWIDKLARSKYKLLGFIISPLEIIFMRSIPEIIGYEMNNYIRIIMSISCLGWFIFFYLGYLMGNGLLKFEISAIKLKALLSVAILIQIAEGYWYYLMEIQNCGTQLKLSSVLTNSIFSIFAFKLIESEKCLEFKALHILGECSFGIYFSHLAIMAVLNHIPQYTRVAFYPLNAIIALLISLCFVLGGKRVLGKYSRYFAL